MAGTIAPPTLGATFWHGMRVAAVDGFLLDVPENDTTRAALGGQLDGGGRPPGVSTGQGGDGEPALATEIASSAADMLVIMDRAFPGVALWKAYTQAGAHLLIRARTFVAAKPVEVLPDGTCPTRMNLAGQRRSDPGVRDSQGDRLPGRGGETTRLLNDLLDPESWPVGEPAALYHERWEVESTSGS